MTVEIPADVLPFVQSLMAGGSFQTEAEVVGAALRSYQQAVEELRGKVLPALERCDAGAGTVVDDAGLLSMKDDLRNRVQTRLQAENGRHA